MDTSPAVVKFPALAVLLMVSSTLPRVASVSRRSTQRAWRGSSLLYVLYVLYVLYGSYTPTSRAVYHRHSISTCTKYALYKILRVQNI